MNYNKNKPISLYVISILLFFSGGASLIYEVVWTRILHYVFGNTEIAAATVLATYMGGLALGGMLGGKYAFKLKRPLLTYGILEGIIALYGLIFTPLLYKLDFIYSFVSPSASPVTLTAIRFIFGVVFMMIPTIAMGATLPVLVHKTVENQKSGYGMAFLYFVNTFGAVVGTFMVGFALIPKYGLDFSVYIAVFFGSLVAISSFILDFKETLQFPEKNTDIIQENSEFSNKLSENALKYGNRVIIFIAFMSGFISLANEVLWFRLLGIIMDGTIYGFSALLTAFLSGIAAGSLWISKKLDKIDDLWNFYIKLQLGALFGSLFFMIFIPFIPFLISGYIAGTPKNPSSVFSLKFLLVFIPVFIPTFFYGAIFPLTVKIASVKNKLSKATGGIYAINTLGCITGAILTGMVLMPYFKNINALLITMLIIALLPPFIAVFLSGTTDLTSEETYKLKFKSSTYLALFLLAILIIKPNVKVVRLVNSRYSIEDYSGTIGDKVKSIYGNPEEQKNLIFESEGEVTIVTVHKTSDGGYRLRNNGLNESYHSTEKPYYAEEIFYLGMLPFLIHPDAKTAMLIGLGGGGTLDIMSQTFLKHIDVAELEPEVVKASRIMFDNRQHPLDKPQVHLWVDDGRNALLRKMHQQPGFYDIIVSQPSHPWLSGAANLYTVEHFKIVRKNLNKNGIFCQWINLFRMNEKGFKSLMAAFTSAFNDGYVFQVDENSVFLMGINGHLKIDPSIVEQKFKNKKLFKLLDTYFSSPQRIYNMYLYDYKTALKLAKGASVNSDHNPIIETVLPWVDHNKMFYVEKLLDKHKLKYGINPSVMPKGKADLNFYEKYVNKIKQDISLDDEEPEKSKKLIKHLENILYEAYTLSQDDVHRLLSIVYEQVSNFNKAKRELTKIQKQNRSDIENYISLLKNSHQNSLAVILEFGNILPFISKYYLSEQNLTHKEVFYIANLTKTLIHLGFNPKYLSFFIKPIYSYPELKSIADVIVWEVLTWFELTRKNPNENILETTLDAGTTDLKLLKQMLMYYAKQDNKEKFELITDLIMTSNDSAKQTYDLAIKMENFGLFKDAYLQVKYLYKLSPKTLEPLLILKKYIELKIKIQNYNEIQSLIKTFYDMSPSNEDIKQIEKLIKKLPAEYTQSKKFKNL